MNIEDLIKNDQSTVNAPTNDELKELNDLCEAQLVLEDQIQQAEDFLKKKKEELTNIRSVAIPNIMDAIGIQDFRMTNGMKITVKQDVYASIRSDKTNEAIEWLDQMGIGDIVKDEVKVNFGRGESKKAAVLLDYCQSHGYKASEKLSVHPQTLKATVKEQLARGVEFPEELFSIYPDRKTVIKPK